MNLRKYTLAAATLAALALIVPAASAVSVTLKWNLSQIRDEDGNRPSAGQFVGYFVPVFDTSGTLATLEDLYGSGDPRGEFAWRLQEVGVSELSVSELLGCYGAAFTTGALGAMSGSFVEEFSGAATISAVVVVFNAPDVESATSFFVTANTIENTIDPSRPISATSFNFGSQAGAQWLRIEYHDDEPEVELHTVTFDLNGHGARTGGGELTQTVTNGCFAVAPEVMAADGWEFAGWEPDVAAAITNDTTFVAQYRALPYWEGSETIDGVTWRFAVTNGFATITGGTNGLAAAEGASGHVQIPESLGGCAVRAIGDRAFKGNINITEVVLHGMVASIGTEAFRGCSGLERATIPAGGLTEIRTRAFQDCASLTSISLPEGIEAVAAYSLMATDIEGADIPEGVVSIGGYAFAYCESLRWVRLPSTLASIGDHAFYGCTALASIDLPDSVSEIGSNAFGYCGALARVTFAGDAPASVSAYAFTDACTNCAAYVSRGSTGWGVEIPGTWKGIRIEYIDDEPAAGVTVAVTEVRQRWPWNGFVDIDCTVTCADAAADVLLSVTARDASTGTDLPVRSVRLENGAFGGELRVRAGDLAGGQVRLIWDAGADLPETVVESAQVEVTATVAAPDAEHEGVQLWEDGPYWATTNIGAEEPWESGLYFWWGDTVGYRREGDAWVASDGSSQNFSFSGGNTPTYGKSVETLQSEGWTTSDGVLAPAHDAAHVQCGGNWRMPTKDELSALGNTNNCNWAWTTTNGVNGYVVSGRGDYASASIFLPAASDGYGTSIRNAGSSGNYWSSVPHSSGSLSSWGLYFYYSGYHDTYSNYRIYGRSVRPVQGFAEAAVPAAASVCADVSAPFRLDTAEGARTMSEGEALPITYSPRWGGAATCSVADNGATLLSGATEEDVLSWTPSSGGRHVLTHIAGTNTLEAVFLVDSMPFDFDTDAVEMAILGGEWDVNSLSMTIELQMNPCSEGGVERFISDVERGALMWSVPGKKVLWDDWCYVAEGMLYGEGVEITASNTVVFRVPLQSDDLQFRFLKIYLEDERSSSRIESSNIVKLTSMANQEGEIVRTVTVGTTPSDFAVPTRVVDFNDFLINHYLGNGEPLVVSCGDRVRFSYDLRELCDYGLGGSDYVTPFIIGEDATCAYGIENDWSDDWEEYGRQFSDRVPNVGFFDLLVWESPGRYALILLPDWDEWWIDDDFSGWWNSLDQMIEEVQREDGVFTIIEVDVVEQSATPTVTFDLGEHGVRTGGGELVQTVTNGCYAVAPTVAANEESAGWWRFDGWDKDFSAVTSDLTVNAVWTPTVPNDFVLTTTIDCEPDERPFVTWTVSHSIPMEWMNYVVVNILAKTSEDGAWVDASDIPDILSDENAFAYVKVVFTFRDDVTTEDGTPVESIESANVVAIPRPAALHTVTFDLGAHGARTGGGELVQSVTNGCYAVAPEFTVDGGWEFTGWVPDVAAAITNDTTFVAQYQALAVWSGAEVVDGIEWKFVVSNGVAEVRGEESLWGSLGRGSQFSTAIPTSTEGAISIPATLGGYPVVSIGDGSFESCHLITSVTIPDSVVNIGNWAFSTGLTSLAIPASVTNIHAYAFSLCSSLMSFSVAAENPQYSSVNGLLLSRDGRTLVHGLNLSDGVTIPEGVVNIGDAAFDECHLLTSVTIPASVTNIGWAFFGCESLTNMTFLGNAPECVYDSFDSINADCTAYVSRGSTGWGVEIPGTWKGIRIEYIDYGPEVTPTILLSGETLVAEGAGTFDIVISLSQKCTEPVAVIVELSDPCSLEIVDCEGGIMKDGHAEVFFPVGGIGPYTVTLNPLDGLAGDGSSTAVVAHADKTYSPGAVEITVTNVAPALVLPVDSNGEWVVEGFQVGAEGVIAIMAEDVRADLAAVLTASLDFGDGTSTNFILDENGFAIVGHTYARANGDSSAGTGGFQITLVVTDKDGGSAIARGRVIVEPPNGLWLEVEQPARGGSIGCESGWHPIDDMFMIQASANPGYRFVEWTGDVAGLYQPSAGRLAVVMDQPRTIGASFAPIEYAISYTGTHGAANPNPATYTVEDEFAFSPLPNVEGWNFQGWTPSGVSASTTGDFTATALWSRPEIIVGVDGWQTTYNYGDTPTFTAPEPRETNGMQVVTLGTTFTAPAVTNEFSLTLTHDIAFFWDILATNWWLDAEAPANGAIHAFDDAGAIATPCWMPDGAGATFEAVPDAGFRFVRWTGDTDGCVETNGLLLATMDRARTIGAEFALNLVPVIDAISPASPTEDDAIVMQGHAEGGAAAEYLWRAAPASGGASTTLGRSQACRAKLPAGAWRIEFLARDASGAWSGEASAEVDVGESLAMPDLQVARANIVFFDALGLPTANVKTGDAVTVRATVQNRGAAALAGGAAVMLCDGIVPLYDLASLATNDARVVALGEAAPLGAWRSQTLELAWRVGLDACGNEVAYEDGPNAFTLVAIPLAGLDADASAANNLASLMLGFGDAGGTLSDLLRVSANCEPTLWEGETYAVSGAVWYERDGSTAAMAGASVALLIDGEAVGETTTDASGRYVCPFTAPAAGEHEFEVRATDGAAAKSGTGAFTSRARADAGGEGGAGSGEEGGGEVVTPLKGPNLVVQALSFTGTNVTTIYSTASAPAGALAGVAATVANAGDVSVTNGFAVVVEISGPSDFAVLAREFNVGLALAPGESADIVWPDALAAELAGAYRARATADANGAIAESSETDNTLNAWLTVEELLPNLVVSAISLSPSRPVAGDAATAAVTVGNAGNAATEEPFAVRLLRDGKPAGEAAIPAGLAAGAATNVAFAVELPSAGTVALEAVANPDGEIPESRRDDNARKLHVPVLPAEADARPVSLSASPYPEAGAACVLTATIRNEGGAAYEGGVATFYEGDPADGRAIGAGTVGAIAWKGGTGEATCVWTPAAASGDRVVTVVLDGRAYVRTFTQTAPPDLRVTAEDISWEPGTPSAGDAMRFRAMVRNVAASAAATNVTVVFTVTDEGGASTTLGAATVPRLAAGGSVAVDAGAAFVAARVVYAVSVAVGDGTGRDADASDNVASRTFGVSVPVAVAAAECTGTTGDAIALDGTASLNAASYRWTLLEAPAGSLAAIENADSAEARLVPAFAGTYRFALVVDDGETESDPAECAAVVDKVVVDVFGETPGGSIEPGGGVFPAGADVAFAPVPDAHHHFVKWIVSDADGCASTNGTLVVRMDRARAVYAKFAIDTFTVSFDPGDHGALAATNGAVQTVAFGERPAIVPAVAPDAGYKFVGWESDPSAAVSADTTFTARYSAFEYAISYEGTRGAVNSNPASYTVEDSVVFAPLPDLAGWEFAGWNLPGIAAGTTGNVSVAASWRRPALSLGEAVGAPWLEWATGGGADWAVEWGADDESAEAWVRSGSVGTNAETWIETTVQGEGTLAFSWRIACESRALHAAVEIDGVVRARLFGTNDWTDASFTLGGGEHVVRWIYRTGRSGGRSAGAAWLDSVRWTPLPPMSLAEALGATNLVWTTGGDAPWGVLRGMEAADGDGCAVSGPIGDYGSSLLSTTVGGAGTLSFWWRVSCEDGYDWFDFYMDGKLQGSLTGESGWRQVSIRIAEGTHELLWEYWKDDMDEDGLTGDDMAFLDRVAFVPDEAVPPPDETPLDEPGYALPEFQEFLRENGYVESGAGNAEINEAAAAKAANGVNTVWQCYVAGIDPEDEDAKFEATITMGADGKPVVKWNPPLSEEEAAKRTYRTLGKKTLDPNEEWIDVTDVDDPDAAGWRFFKVKVEMR